MSHPIPFKQANQVLDRPEGTTREECGSLEVFRDGKQCISRWQFSDSEIEELKRNGGKVYLWVMMGATQPPVYVSPDNPFKVPDAKES